MEISMATTKVMVVSNPSIGCNGVKVKGVC